MLQGQEISWKSDYHPNEVRVIIPGMTDTYDMVNITQRELQKLICKYACSICESEEGVVCEYSSETHRPRMQDRFMT